MPQFLPRILRFAGYKIPLTLLSASSLWALTGSGAGMLYAAPLVSLTTQLTEFLVMRNLVFKNRNNGRGLVLGQFIAFWAMAATLAMLEGIAMSALGARGFGFVPTYVLGHVPIFFLRFYGDQKIFSNHRKTPGSS